MFKNYLITALRAFYNRSGAKGGRTVFSYINIFGLTIGFTAFLIIIHIVRYEQSFDAFFDNSDNICRVAVRKSEAGNLSMESARTWPGIGILLKEEIPGVINYARLYKEECMLHYKERDIKFNRQYTFWADRSFITMFNLDFVLEGDLGLMDKPWGAVISESAAKRFFGTDWEGKNNPIGKTIHLNESLGFSIQGVYRDLPPNSHMAVDFIVSWSTLVMLAGQQFENSLPPNWNAAYVYLQHSPETSVMEIQSVMKKLLMERIPELAAREVSYDFFLQPIESIHLHSDLDDELRANGNSLFVYSLLFAALLILIVAWINFINLMTVRSLDRAKEVGVRKAIGSSRAQLVIQFLSEAIISAVMAGVLALLLVFLLEGKVREFTQIQLPVITFSGNGSLTLILFAIIAVAGGILAGIYPALRLSSSRTADIIKGRVELRGRGYVRKTLIAFQFFCAVFLVSATGVVYKQLDYMRNQELGMEPEQVVVLHSPRSMIGSGKRVQRFRNFREKLLPHAAVTEMGSSACIPGNEFLVRTDNVQRAGEERRGSISYDIAYVDEGYLPTLGIKLIAGRNFQEQRGEEMKTVISEKAASVLGFSSTQDAVGKFIRMDTTEYQVISVMEDTHYQGLQKAISPVILFYGHAYEFGFFSLKVSTDNLPGTISTIEAVWKEIYPNDPFDYFFLDSFFDQQYANDKTFGQLFGAFSLLAIFIACLGLIGLVGFTLYQKTKEIGIRKALGASIWNILTSLTKEFSKPVLVACIIAIPATQYALTKWLEGFAYQYDFSWWMHLVPLIIVNGLALLAISWQSVKAALANPVDALKEE